MKFAVLGDPVAHSKSPAMHAAAYRALGLEHTYEAIRCDAAGLARLVGELRAGAFAGFNVTVPHKRRVLDLVDSVAASAAAVGAANTIVVSEGKVVAHNTDVPALTDELRLLGPDLDWGSARALVLGTGGAARAAVAALERDLGAHVVVRGRASAADEPLVASPSTEGSVVAVVQATSAGMTGADAGEPIARAVAWDALPARAVAIDLVYAPPETPFLRAARARGLRSTNGLGMLARQGALAFQLWLGVAPAAGPLDAMLSSLR